MGSRGALVGTDTWKDVKGIVNPSRRTPKPCPFPRKTMPPETSVDAIEKKSEAQATEYAFGTNQTRARFYEPLTPEEKALDKSLNLRLDFCVVLILAINFIVPIPTILPHKQAWH